jgi:chemotaxis protein CheZ
MSVANTRSLDALVDHARRSASRDVSLSDVVRLAEISAETFQAFFQAIDSAMLREMREIAEYITAMKHEIGTLQVNDIRNSRIPAAGQELDAIVKATEAATHTIMECAEAVMGADAGDAGAYKRLVDEKMLVVFEACSFQDITGQRVAKVVETLQHIEARVSRFADAVRAPDIAAPLNERERALAERKASLLMHGPQLEGNGIGQSEVDSLLAKGKTTETSQSEIDRLFA